MRVSSAILALPALASAQAQGQGQAPLVEMVESLKGYWNMLTNSVGAAVPHVPHHPAQAGAAKVAEHVQHELTLQNWKQVLTTDVTASPPTTQDWAIFTTGGAVTCYGMCGNATKAWNVRGISV